MQSEIIIPIILSSGRKLYEYKSTMKHLDDEVYVCVLLCSIDEFILLYETKYLFYLIIDIDHFIKWANISILMFIFVLKSMISTNVCGLLTLYIIFM